MKIHFLYWYHNNGKTIRIQHLRSRSAANTATAIENEHHVFREFRLVAVNDVGIPWQIIGVTVWVCNDPRGEFAGLPYVDEGEQGDFF